jgi:hypothetical protein
MTKRPKHSTDLAAAELVDRVIKSLDAGNKSLVVFMDLSKAFDTLDHSILIAKLRYYGLHKPMPLISYEVISQTESNMLTMMASNLNANLFGRASRKAQYWSTSFYHIYKQP